MKDDRQREKGRSREGAWIEIQSVQQRFEKMLGVAPARERGLKFRTSLGNQPKHKSRSREGAWIEIAAYSGQLTLQSSRSREGAWIEIPTLERLWPYGYSRSREGAWIEMLNALLCPTLMASRSREGAWIEIGFIGALGGFAAKSLPRGSVD